MADLKRKLEDVAETSSKSSLSADDQDLVDAFTLSSQACVQSGLAYLTSSSAKMSASNLLAVAPLCLAGKFGEARQLVKAGIPSCDDLKERRAEAGEMGKALKAIYQRIRDDEEGTASSSASSLAAATAVDLSLLPNPPADQTFRQHRISMTAARISSLPPSSVSSAVLIAWALALLDEYDEEPRTAGDKGDSLLAQLRVVLSTLNERTYASSSKSYQQLSDTVISISDLPYGNVGASPLDAMFPLPILSRFASLFPSLFPSLPSSPSLLCRILSTAYNLAQRGDQEGSSHGCVLFNSRNEPVSVGWNHRYPLVDLQQGGGSSSSKPAKRASNRRDEGGAAPAPRCKVIHAETHAILQLPEAAWKEDVEGGQVWVVEIAGGGDGDGSGKAEKDKDKEKSKEEKDKRQLGRLRGRTFLDAFPCPNCTSAMTKLGVRRAFFTKMDGRVGAWFMGEKNDAIGAETFEFVRKNDTFTRLDEEERRAILGNLKENPDASNTLNLE